MGKVIIGTTLSLDGFMADRNGSLDPIYPEREALIKIGGADVSHQILETGLADELSIGIAPVVLGEGLPFFTGDPLKGSKLVPTGRMVAAGATYLNFRIIHPAQRTTV